MGALVRAFDWSSTPLGPARAWPTSLKTIAGVVLASRFPMLLFWGRELRQLYNDAYRPILGDKHPASLGAPGAAVWREIWHVIGPQAEGVFAGGPATWNEDLLLPLNRNGGLEEAYFTYSYSAVPDEAGEVGGVLVTVRETTEQVRAQRQLELLRALAVAAEARTPGDACRAAADVLATNDADVPFALLYLLDDAGTHADLVATVGFARTGEPCTPLRVSLAASEDGARWPLRAAWDTELYALEVDERYGALPSGRWGRRPSRAVIARLRAAGEANPYGFLVAGVSPMRPLDERYAELFRLAAERVTTAIRGARAFEEQRKRAEALAEADRAKTTFFTNVSHEFRTPLTLMLGPTEDLISGTFGELTAPQRGQLELLRRNQLRLQRLVNALLEFSRIEAGRARAHYERADLARLTRDVASSFRAAIERAGLELVVDCPPLASLVAVDVAMWEQVVLNLLSNAFKFTFEGRVRVSLRDAGEDVVLQVEDTGVGVPADDLPRLFERFHRVEGTRARTHEGTGIGLALVRELVRLHGGRVQVESAYGVGTTFTAHIPRHAAAAERGEAPSARVPALAPSFVEEAIRWLGVEDASDGAPREPGAARILVADDNADMRDYLRRTLEARWEVEVVADGAAALAAAKRRPPDVLLSDVMMPALDGLRLIAALRADPATRDVHVMLLSARAGEESRVEGLGAGADDYLVKPFSARELLARVAVHVEAAHRRRAADAERARLRAIFDGAPALICVLRGPDHVIELANEPYSRLVAGRAVSGVPMRQAIPEIESQGYLAVLDDVYRSGTTRHTEASRVLLDAAGDGVEEHFLNITYVPSRSSDGAVDGIIVFGFVVTEHVHAQRAAESERYAADGARRRAESAVVARDEFFSVASHELRTPLTTLGLQIDGLVRSLAAEAPSAGPMEAAIERWIDRGRRLRAQADRLEHLIEAMLDAVAGLPERAEAPVDVIDLADVARDVVLRARSESKRAHDTLELSAESVTGSWERAYVEQLLFELLSNALKFGQGRTITVRLEAVEGGARVVVTDRGIGIAPGDHRRIFERFERATPSDHFGGFGLGLWHAHELTRALGGTIDVASEPGRGATFVVSLPGTS